MRESAYLTYYQRNRDVTINRAKDYNENYKERLTEQARYKYRNLSEEEKNKKRDISICLKERKTRLKKHQKNYCEVRKSQYNNE